MTCLGCNAIESGPTVTLHDGANVCNVCPAWLTECEARDLLRLPHPDIPGALLAREKKRGKDAVNSLRKVMVDIYQKGKKCQD